MAAGVDAAAVAAISVICAIEFFISVEVRIKQRTSEPIYGQRHAGEKRIVHSPATIGATNPLPRRGLPLKISNHLLGCSPAQFKPSQTTVGERRSPEVQRFATSAREKANAFPHDKVVAPGRL